MTTNKLAFALEIKHASYYDRYELYFYFYNMFVVVVPDYIVRIFSPASGSREAMSVTTTGWIAMKFLSRH